MLRKFCACVVESCLLYVQLDLAISAYAFAWRYFFLDRMYLKWTQVAINKEIILLKLLLIKMFRLLAKSYIYRDFKLHIQQWYFVHSYRKHAPTPAYLARDIEGLPDRPTSVTKMLVVFSRACVRCSSELQYMYRSINSKVTCQWQKTRTSHTFLYQRIFE